MAGTKKNNHFYWRLAAGLITAVILLPIILVAGRSFFVDQESIARLASSVLPKYLFNTGVLVLGIAICTLLIGTTTAWIVSIYEFPGRKYFEWLLILPLSVPTFINAIAYVGLTDYSGPIQVFFRWLEFPIYLDIMHHLGAILIMSLVLFPYVYVAARAAFLVQSSSLLEASASLGKNLFYSFFKVALPISWPAIFAGLILVIMEVINDFGVASYFGIPTFTTGIFKFWLALGDLPSAVFLALLVLIFILGILALEHIIEKNKRLSTSKSLKSNQRIDAKTPILMFCMCFLPLAFGFLLPVSQLSWWATITIPSTDWFDLGELFQNTAILGFFTCICILICSVVLGYAMRLNGALGWKKLFSKTPMLGYAMPGAVIAIGIIAMILVVNPNWIYASVMALVLGYSIRYFAVGYGPITTAFEKIPSELDQASMSLGKSTLHTLTNIHLPLLKPAFAAAAIMIFIDVSKELPLTLMLRPFNFETLATNAFQYAKDEMAPRSAAPSLLIILISALPAYLLNKTLNKIES